MKRAPTKIAEMATTEAYQRGLMIQNNVQEFLRALGYQAMGEAVLNGLGIAPAFAVLGGLGELSRLNRVITPEYGPMVRIFKFVTDLPLEADKPIDAGIARFCKSCKKCAEACPPAALSFDTEPNWQPVGAWSNAGHQAWFEDSLRCKRYWHEELGTNCGICFAVCPFSKRNASFMHDLIRMQIAVSPTFNDIMRNVDDAFGYGVQKSPDQWWSLDLPEFGIDTGRD
jgi:reductive dehalogenase